MKIALFGYGKMGKMVERCALEQGHQIVQALSEAEVSIDFSHPQVLLNHLHEAASAHKPLVIGTTGWEAEFEKAKTIVETSGIAVLYASNFSLSMAHFQALLKQARTLLKGYDVAGIEYHHSQKLDAPSGTAKKLAQVLEMETPFATVRCGRIPGIHEVLFDSPFDTLKFTHEAHSREPFAQGALKAAEWIQDKVGWFTFDEMVRSLYSPHHPL